MSAPPHDTTQTRGVLAGAYRGRRGELENLKTHLVYVSRGVDVGVACRQPLHHIADEHSAESEEELQERPTCATCGRAWDRLQRPTPNARRPPPTARIVRVLEVKDTRDYEEGPDGKFYPIPGSGTPSECARCGRTHYVHATVLLSDETSALVGTGCMNQSEMVVAKQAKSAERLAKQVAKLQAEYTVQMQRYEAYEQARKQVEKLPLPAYREDRKYFAWAKKELPVMILGDVEQAMPFVEGRDVSHDNWQRKNVREQLVSAWREARIKDMGIVPAGYPRDTERALERAEKKLEGMIG